MIWIIGKWDPNDIKKLLDKVIKEYNVDRDNIVIMGHSFGGGNAPRVAKALPGYFSKAVICSGYDYRSKEERENNESVLLDIPTQWYFGGGDTDTARALDQTVKNAIENSNDVKNIYCHENTWGHGTPYKAYGLDNGRYGGTANNNCSDLIEWMFEDYTAKKGEPQKETKVNLFDENITYSKQYLKKDEAKEGIMAHGVLIPSTANTIESMPLIVWLHGYNDGTVTEHNLMEISSRLPKVIMDSKLEKFNAYILCPQIDNTECDWYSGQTRVNEVSDLIEFFVNKYKNVDTNNIVIMGHSSGGVGAAWMAEYMEKMPYDFSKLVIMSGTYGTSKITIPTRGYYGEEDGSEYIAFHTRIRVC